MRKFSSYGPVDTDLHYYVPREALIQEAYSQLVGENPNKGAHYITVWAPRQRGKSWVMVQTLQRLQEDERFDAIALSLQHLQSQTDVDKVVQDIAISIVQKLGIEEVRVNIPSPTRIGLLGRAERLLSYLPLAPRFDGQFVGIAV